MNPIYNPFAWANAQISAALAGQGVAPWGISVVTTLLASVLLIGFSFVSVMLAIWGERRVVARVQVRIGPNRVGPLGLLQSVADALKLLSKEDIIPANVDRAVFLAAPIVVLLPALLAWAIIPWAPGAALANLDIGVLYLLAIDSLTTLAVIMAGWSSNNKYSLLGGMRAAAQVISYEIPLVLSVVGIVLLAGTLSVDGIVRAQDHGPWLVFLQPIGFLVFVIASIAELNRTPFDLVEGESEIIGGYHTEYSGMRFALFFLAEYLNSFVFAMLASTLFLGGYAGLPWLGTLGLPPYLWLMLKAAFFMFLLFWLRGTLPRLRIDQLLAFAWKVLLPLALVNIVIAGLEAEALRAFGIVLGVPAS